MLQRLSSASPSGRVAKALTTLGRIVKTIFIPRYVHEEKIRRRVQLQLSRGEARHELARHYLLHSSRELNETAYLLGYEDANSFFRAFHQWEGTSPGQWRMLQNNPGHD